MPLRTGTCSKPGVTIFLPRNTEPTVMARYMAPPTIAARPDTAMMPIMR